MDNKEIDPTGVPRSRLKKKRTITTVFFFSRRELGTPMGSIFLFLDYESDYVHTNAAQAPVVG